MKHECTNKKCKKTEYFINLCSSIIIGADQPKKKFGIPEMVICYVCKKSISDKIILETIGEEDYKKLEKKVIDCLKKKNVQFHNHEIILKDDFIKQITDMNVLNPGPYEINYGNKLACYINDCKSLINIEEIQNQMEPVEIEKLISNIKNEIENQHPKKDLSFHCRIIYYNESLKYVKQELIEYNRIHLIVK